jgi:parallel beta-helix repeat protein
MSCFAKFLTVFACAWIAALLVPASASVYVVSPGGSGSSATIQDAIDAAHNGDTIMLADGVFTGVGNCDIDFSGKAIHVCAMSGEPEECVVDCEGNGRGFFFRSGEGRGSVLEGITIRNGAVYRPEVPPFPPSGAGISCTNGSSPLISRCAIVDSYSGVGGGGIGCVNSSPLLDHCAIAGNSSSPYGGGIYVEGTSSPMFSGCRITGNHAYTDGGGIYFSSAGAPTMVHCTLSGNRAGQRGGGIYDYGTGPRLWNCIVYFNGTDTEEGHEWYCDGGAYKHCCSDIREAGLQGWCSLGSCTVPYGSMDENPLFCDAVYFGDAPTSEGDYRLCEDSPCADAEYCSLIGALGVGCAPCEAAGVDDPLPSTMPVLSSVLPNPVSGVAQVSYRVPEALGSSPVELRVCDVTGRVVRTLVNDRQPAGSYMVTWDGLDGSGQPVGPGAYFCQITMAGRSSAKTIILVKQPGNGSH